MPTQLNAIFQRLGESRDLALALTVAAIIGMLILPMPGWLLDFGLAISITVSVMILMTALFIEKPLQLSSFPTILLIATMLRLGLNIASTRLILGHGHEGTHAAGGVIGAFGEFLMGGETVIGLTHAFAPLPDHRGLYVPARAGQRLLPLTAPASVASPPLAPNAAASANTKTVFPV